MPSDFVCDLGSRFDSGRPVAVSSNYERSGARSASDFVPDLNFLEQFTIEKRGGIAVRAVELVELFCFFVPIKNRTSFFSH
jgi:hypothetical protein